MTKVIKNKTLQNKKTEKTDSVNPQIVSKMAKLLKKYQNFATFKVGDRVEGRVLEVFRDRILVDFGGKSEGVITGREFVNLKKLGQIPAVGEKILAVVANPEDETGATVLSVRTTTVDTLWEKLEKLSKEGEEVEAKIKGLAKGGILADISGLRAFIPAIFADVKILQDFGNYAGKKIKVRLVEVDKAVNRLICQVVKKPPKEELESLEKKYQAGQKYSGKISATLPFGVTVSFNGRTAFVPNSEISWGKIDDTQKIFEKDKSIDFVFLGVDKTTGEAQISPKQATPDPLEKIAEFGPETTLAGMVSRISDFGVFVTLDLGVEGLVHISKIPPDVKFEVGQKVTCTIDSIDKVARKVSLSPVLKTKPIGYR